METVVDALDILLPHVLDVKDVVGLVAEFLGLPERKAVVAARWKVATLAL